MIVRGLVAVTLLSTLAACGSSGDQADPVSSASTAQAVSSAPPTTPPTTTLPESNTPSTTPVPTAKDGTNYKACNDGTCEVLIRKQAVLNLDGDKFTATAAAATLKLTDSHGYISLSRNGSDVSRSGGGGAGSAAGGLAAVSWNNQGGPLHIATLTYAEGDTVIVSFTTK